MKLVRSLLVVALLIVYTLLVHYVNASGKPTVLGAVLALIPLVLLAAGMALNRKTRYAGLLLLVAGGLLAWLIWPELKQHYGVMFWLQDLALMLILMATFARTLFKGRKPLCVHFAEIINRGPLPADHEQYARNLTRVWVAFFAAIAMTSTLLFFLASQTTWSIFVNFVTLPLVALMFIVEYLVRRRVLSNLPEGSVMDAVRAYRNESARAH